MENDYTNNVVEFNDNANGDVSLVPETTVTGETGQTDIETGTVVSDADSLAASDTPTDGCLFTDENILEKIEAIETNTMEKLETINATMVVKMDILITLILVIIAIRMFSPLANNHKRGLDKKESK